MVRFGGWEEAWVPAKKNEGGLPTGSDHGEMSGFRPLGACGVSMSGYAWRGRGGVFSRSSVEMNVNSSRCSVASQSALSEKDMINWADPPSLFFVRVPVHLPNMAVSRSVLHRNCDCAYILYSVPSQPYDAPHLAATGCKDSFILCFWFKHNDTTAF